MKNIGAAKTSPSRATWSFQALRLALVAGRPQLVLGVRFLPDVPTVPDDERRRVRPSIVVLDVGVSATEDQLILVSKPARVLRGVDPDDFEARNS